MTDSRGGQTGQTVTELVVIRVKQVRRRRGLTVAQLADRCAALGAPETTTNVLANIEAGRRQVNVNQLATLALALDVAPVHLLACPEGTQVQVTTTTEAPAPVWAAWLNGSAPLPEGDENAFWAYCLENTDSDASSQALINLARQRTTATTHKIVAELQEQADARLAQMRALAEHGLDAVEEAVARGNSEEILAAVKLARSLLPTQGRARTRTPDKG